MSPPEDGSSRPGGAETAPTTSLHHTDRVTSDPNGPTGGIVDFAALLGTLGFADGEFVSIGRDGDGVFRTAVLPPWQAPAYVAQLPTTANVFFGVNPTKGPARQNAGRGKEADVTRLAALVCDLDVKAGACASLDTARAIIGDLTAALGTRPSVIVHSGHGIHGYWPVADGAIGEKFTTGQAAALLRRFGRLVSPVAADHGAKADSVFDLARMMRVPGTTNNKMVA